MNYTLYVPGTSRVNGDVFIPIVKGFFFIIFRSIFRYVFGEFRAWAAFWKPSNGFYLLRLSARETEARTGYEHTVCREGMVLTQEEIDGCRDAFLAFDKDRSGNIDVWELRQVGRRALEVLGILKVHRESAQYQFRRLLALPWLVLSHLVPFHLDTLTCVCVRVGWDDRLGR